MELEFNEIKPFWINFHQYDIIAAMFDIVFIFRDVCFSPNTCALSKEEGNRNNTNNINLSSARQRLNSIGTVRSSLSDQLALFFSLFPP